MADPISLRVNNGWRYYAIVIYPGKNIQIAQPSREVGKPGTVRTFRIGDMAEYHSYNLSFFGPIKSISAKTVVIMEKHGRNPRKHILKIPDFATQNADFDLAAATKRNHEWSD